MRLKLLLATMLFLGGCSFIKAFLQATEPICIDVGAIAEDLSQ